MKNIFAAFPNKWLGVFSCFIMMGLGNFACGQSITNNALLVDPFVGTADDCGQLSPAASLPFGLVKLGPQTVPTGQAGYNYSSPHISGFTINRLEGVGCSGAGGNLLMKPGIGDISTQPYTYIKESEKASPGYYTVRFKQPDIKVELTVANAAGIQNYTFNQAGKAWIMIDLASSLDSLLKEEHQLVGNKLSGSISAMSVCKLGAYKFYYAVQIGKNADSVMQQGSKIWYYFKVKQGEVIDVKTAVSSIDQQTALQTINKLRNTSFGAIRSSSGREWAKKLGKITVKGKDKYVKLFYTHYYHTLLSPFKLSETDGRYRGSDAKLYQANGFNYYHGWSLWDNFRTEMPLLTITEPSIMKDICKSLAQLYRQGKAPWATFTEPFPTVRTEHALIVLLDCYQKGITGFDLNGIYPLLKAEAAKLPNITPDQQLETAYDIWAMSRIAGLTGHKADSIDYVQQASAYRKIWNEKFKVMNDKSDVVGGDGLYEGTIWQYRWFVPFDNAGVMDMMGKQAYLDQLTYFFDHYLYNPANEPDISVPFLFNITGQSYKTQQIVNSLLTKPMRDDYATHNKFSVPYQGRVFKLEPHGYVPEMDDDAGTMAAWYVLSSMGLYPACVGQPVYWLTSPVFKSVTINLSNNKTFRITTRNFSDSSFYIQKVFLNGAELKRNWITHKEIASGGKLEFVLGKNPNPKWGANKFITSLSQ